MLLRTRRRILDTENNDIFNLQEYALFYKNKSYITLFYLYFCLETKYIT